MVNWKQTWLAGTGIIGALVSTAGCPACWTALAGLLSALGLGFLLSNAVTLAFTAAFLFVALFALGFRARRRRGYTPLLVGLAAALLVLTGKFLLVSLAVMYTGGGLLILASVWNAWPGRAAPDAPCPHCALTELPSRAAQEQRP